MKLENLKKFSELKLFEQGQFPEAGITVVRVPGGWVFTTFMSLGSPSVALGVTPKQENFVNSVFVPKGKDSDEDIKTQLQELVDEVAKEEAEKPKSNLIIGNIDEEKDETNS